MQIWGYLVGGFYVRGSRNERMEARRQTRGGLRSQGEVETRRSEVRALMDRHQVLGSDLDHRRIRPSVVGSVSFVEAQLHQTRGGADSRGEVETQRSGVHEYRRLERERSK